MVRANSSRLCGASATQVGMERRAAFIAQLGRMSSQERIRAAQYEFERWQRAIWVGCYPDEVPTVNGEVEWIALGLADLD